MYLVIIGPILFLLALPFKKHTTLFINLSYCRPSTEFLFNITLWGVMWWIIINRFILGNLDADDLQFYSLCFNVISLCNYVGGKAYTTHYKILMELKSEVKPIEYMAAMLTINTWKKQDELLVRNELKNTVNRLDIDHGLLYMNFMIPLENGLFRSYKGLMDEKIEIIGSLSEGKQSLPISTIIIHTF